MNTKFDREQYVKIARYSMLLIGIFVGAIALTLLFGFFGYVLLFVLLGYIIYLRRSIIRLPAGLNEDHAIDVLFIAIIVSLIMDIVQAAPLNDAIKRDKRREDIYSTATTDMQAKDEERATQNSSRSQEDTSGADLGRSGGLKSQLPGSTTSLQPRELTTTNTSSQIAALNYRQGAYTGGSRYKSDRDRPHNRAVDTKTTVRIVSPSIKPPNNTVTTENQSSNYSQPLPKHDDGGAPYVQRPAKPVPSREKPSKQKPSKQKPIKRGHIKQEPGTYREVKEDKGKEESGNIDESPKSKSKGSPKPPKTENPEKQKPDKRERSDEVGDKLTNYEGLSEVSSLE